MAIDPNRIYALPRNLVLAASAGTGKTHALVGVVVHLLIADRHGRGARGQPVDPARVVATTFSRKAAAEIRARVTQELERLGNDPTSSPYYASLCELGSVPANAIAPRARRALARLPAARFGTLHSFATGIVRSYAVELGIGPRFDLATEADARARAEDAIARALEARLTTAAGVVRALADAASGIDRLVVQLRRMLVQLEEDGRSARDLVVSDTDATTIEATMQAFVELAKGLFGAPRFEAAARDLVSAWERRDDAALGAAVVALCAISIPAKKPPDVEAFGVFRRDLPGTTNDERGRRLVHAYRARHMFAEHALVIRDVLADAEAAIEGVSRARATLGFGEILRAARELLRDRPDVADEVASGMDALLVDEFQDTSRVQRDLLQLLWAEPGARVAGQIPPLARVRAQGLLVVGDRKQSIYGFRGADVGVFAELAVGLAGAPAREALGIPVGVTWEPASPLADFCALRHNRRSVPAILAFANAFSARRFVPGDPPPELFEIEYVPSTEDLLVPPERPAPEAVEARTTWLRIHPKGNVSSRLEEALVIGDRIRAIVAAGKPLVGRTPRAPSWRDIAVLATTNGMIDAVAFALAQSDVPYVVAGKSFFRTREVRDLAAMLALALDPSDRLAMLEVLRGPWAAVHDETLIGLTSPGSGLVSPHQWTRPPRPELVHEEDRGALESVAALVQDLARTGSRLGPGTILREAVRARAIESVLGALPRGEQRVANIRKLLAIADRHADARAFRRWLDEASEQELAESEAATFSEGDDAVRLLTVHASKGLDFPIVFVPEVGSGLPRVDKGAVRIAIGAGDSPNQISVRTADDTGVVLEAPSYLTAYATTRRRERAERQRLAYVAVTRAADAMFLVGGRAKERSGDIGASSLAVLEELASDPRALASAGLTVEDVEVPPPVIRSHEAPVGAAAEGTPAARRRVRPAWRSLPIAPTALADFDHCPRRFELIHLLGFPERVRGRGEAARPTSGALDARAQGTLAHAVLERVPSTAFATETARTEASRALVAEGVGTEHPQHDAIVQRVTRFLESRYAREVAGQKAEIRREVAFVLAVRDDEGRDVVLRGSIDLVIVWPDGSVDVVDYKSARGGGPDAYAFQLDVYTLAARAEYPKAPRLRAGLVFLGGAAGEPTWRTLPDEAGVRRRLASLGDALSQARWSSTFPRVELARCEAIYCGFIGRCHAATSGQSGTDAKPSRVTTT